MNIFAAITARIRVAGLGIPGKFGCQYQPVAQATYGGVAANQFFTTATRVNIGGVYKIAARVNVLIENSFGNVIGRTPSGGAKSHGTQGKGANNQT